MGCERGGNYKKKISSNESYNMKVKCQFMQRFVSNGCGWKVMVRFGFHNYKLAKNLDGHDVLGSLKDDETQLVNDITKYDETLMYIIIASEDRDPENLKYVTSWIFIQDISSNFIY